VAPPLKDASPKPRASKPIDGVILHTHKRAPLRSMTSLRRFTCNDLFQYNNVNLDVLTETYNLPFYLTYLARWPEYCTVAEGPGNQIMG
jgi:hypothetical protein